MSRVVVVGDVMIDVVVRPMDEVAPTSDTPAEVRVSRGGAAATLASAVAAAGHHVRFVGAAGDDEGAGLVENALRRAGVEPQLWHAPARTGVVVALVAPDGQRAMLTDRGANPLLDATFVRSRVGDCDHLHVSGYSVLDEATRALVVAVLRDARDAGCTTSVDVCSVAPLVRVGGEVFRRAVAGADFVFANAEEALVLAGTDDEDAALGVLAAHFAEVLVTRGARGARVARGGERWVAPARTVRVVDTTGAGDAATGAYLAARLQGLDVPAALERAMDAGARAVESLGSNY
ncbi:MAG: carbohydrate kinase family protein [Acidimicrobiales bacterium]